MLSEVNEAQKYLKAKFGDNPPKAGRYAVPTKTSKGDAFMEVTLSEDMKLGSFRLFWDEELTKSWYD